MTHAKRGHPCDLCGKVAYGNGGKVSHGRGHVRRGEAVELEKYYPGGDIMRVFLPAGDAAEINRWLDKGYAEVLYG